MFRLHLLYLQDIKHTKMATIGMFDSGCGGLSVLKATVDILPDEKYIYYADNAHCPYGDKSPEYIRERCGYITEHLVKEGADIITVACNTATAAAITFLRERYSDSTSEDVRERVLRISGGRTGHIRFIGMEPAVKPAALGTATGVIGVLATAGTLKGSKYLKTKGTYEDNCRICEKVGDGFVQLVEKGMTSGPEAESIVRKSLEPLLKEGADTIVLGCTHYPFLLDVMEKIAGPGIRFIDPAPAVARHLEEVMQEEGIQFCSKIGRDGGNIVHTVPDVRLESSGDISVLRKMFNGLFRKGNSAWPYGRTSVPGLPDRDAHL